MLAVCGIGLRGDAVRRASARREAAVPDSEVGRPAPVEHRGDATIRPTRSRHNGRRLAMQISAQQLAELLLGIARAQAAIIQGLENEMAGVRSGRIIPALQNVAHMRDHPQPTLTDLPVRVLLGTLGRQVPDAAALVRELERLFGGGAGSAAAAPEPSGENLDFSKPA